MTFNLIAAAERYQMADYEFRTADLDTADAPTICGEYTAARQALISNLDVFCKAFLAQAAKLDPDPLSAELDALRRQNAELLEERDCYLGGLALIRNQQADVQVDPAHRAVALAQAELRRAMSLYPAMHSAHEGYAVLLEEVEELWAEIKRNPRERDPQALHAEAIQVAAMSLRLIADVTLPGFGGEE